MVLNEWGLELPTIPEKIVKRKHIYACRDKMCFRKNTVLFFLKKKNITVVFQVVPEKIIFK